MADKIKMAVSWAAACGGCDVSVLDTEEQLLVLAELADIVYWPVAMDFKRKELLALSPKSIDIGLFNGAVRTSEQRHDAEIFREKCKVLVAYGSCACFGGIPGLGNFATREEILDVAYESTPSTENPDGVRPQTTTAVKGGELTLPAFLDTVHSLPQVVDVDVVMPGCPPPTERVLDLFEVVKRYVATGELPPAGTVLAEDKALCDSCPRRDSRQGGRLREVVRPHEALADGERCFLEQGMLCLGLATRGGCGATCIGANMPCRGCFGPTADMLDPAAEALSAIGSIAGEGNENFVQAHEMKKAVRAIRDPAGTFYRFTLPSALLPHVVKDEPAEDKS
ncbi:MAG: oxidoreductase [Deltaproteobacteria bacterium]|nr:oxidoreductase [Deltaproteobacteria bacterium]